METTRSTKARARRLHMPIGYRFCPTDEEIIIHYLRPKVFSFPLPAPAIIHSHHHHPFQHHPAALPGDPKEKRYFFCKTSFHHHHHHASVSSPAGGYWKPILKNHKLILATGCNHPIGFKKSFVFYQFSDHRPSASRTPWILHQIHLLYPIPLKMEEWVVCSIQFKSKKAKTQHQSRPHEEESFIPVVIDDDSTITNIGIGFDPPQPAASTSTSSSGITFNDDMDGPKEEEEEEEEESTLIDKL